MAYSDSLNFFLLKWPQGSLAVAKDIVNACDIMPPKTIEGVTFIPGVMVLKLVKLDWEQDV